MDVFGFGSTVGLICGYGYTGLVSSCVQRTRFSRYGFGDLCACEADSVETSAV